MKPFHFDERIYKPDEILQFITDCGISDCKCIRYNNQDRYYFNIASAFDIETSSFYRDKNFNQYSEQQLDDAGFPDEYKNKLEKISIMYVWQFGINGYNLMGRTWQEFIKCIDTISEELSLVGGRRLIVYVHNLSYEFQFIRKWFEWESTFNTDDRKPIQAVTTSGIEFRDSYILSGYGLQFLSNDLMKYKVNKAVGDLDYKLVRHSQTPLTDKEIGYCINDIRVVMAYIQEKIENEGAITNIPLTKTSYVRRYCRNKTLYNGGSHKNNNTYKNYRDLMKDLTLTEKEYYQAKRAFQGGFTHANAMYVGKEVKDVTSFDFTSSYPSVMVAELYPMAKGKEIIIKSEEQFNRLNKNYCTMFDCKFYNLRPKIFCDNPLSFSKCWQTVNHIENNGRIVYADEALTTLTNVDFEVMQDFYEWDKLEVWNFRAYIKAPLPRNFVDSILKLYEDKTTLKGVEGRELEYMIAKGMLNACYGMTVTDIVRDDYIYTDDWYVSKADAAIQINDYNKDKARFLFYLWGVFVTAYARRNLFTGIKEFKGDYIYSDTDSIKVVNVENHVDYIEKYNKWVIDKLETACKIHGFDVSRIKPKTVEGVEKPLGVWDYDGHYTRFKTLGAKRYLYEYLDKEGNLKHKLTVAGVNKSKGMIYLEKKYKEQLFENFTDGLYIPAKWKTEEGEIMDGSGKNTHTYIDEEKSGFVVDYLGNIAPFYEKSSVHLQGASYDMSLGKTFVNYLKGIKQYVYL